MPAKDAVLWNSVRFHDANDRPWFEAGKVGSGGFDLGGRGGFGRRNHRGGRGSLWDRGGPHAAFEISHLLDDVGGGQAGQTRIFWAACSFGAMTISAGQNIGPAAMSDDFRQRRMILR